MCPRGGTGMHIRFKFERLYGLRVRISPRVFKSLNSWRLATLNNSVSGRKRVSRRNINTVSFTLITNFRFS